MVSDSWENFFLGQLGASAALGGLLFVSVSLNLTRILSFATLPGRAFDALLLLVAVLVVSSLMLIPAQPPLLLGGELLAIGIGIWLTTTVQAVRLMRQADADGKTHFLLNLGLLQFAVLPYVIAGLVLMTGNAAGLYWVAAAMLLSTMKSVLDAWVLLVEINR